MQKKTLLLLLPFLILATMACNQGSFKKTKSGLVYQLFSKGDPKDSLLKTGWAVKFDYVRKFNDSVLYDSHGKMPGFARVENSPNTQYSILELLPLMRKGDSAVAIEMVDSLIKRGAQINMNVKKGDRFVTTFRILEVYTVDSLAQAEYTREMKKDMPRRLKEQMSQVAETRKKNLAEMQKSGEIARGIQTVEDYLKNKNITNAKKTESGVFYTIQDPGTGPALNAGKYARIKYSGRLMANDSTFESSVYPLQVGVGGVIHGWDEGLVVFNQGGKGTLFIPGFLAYGSQPGPGGKTFEPLVFDIEVLEVSDEPIAQPDIVPGGQ